MLLPFAFLVFTWIVGVFAFPALRTFRWHHEINGITHAQDWIESGVRYCRLAEIAITGQTINDWISHRLSPDDPSADILMDPPRLDAWGNPYRTQTRDSLDDKPMVYSTGEDGLSKSGGNDPDDIRSWDELRCKWYSQRQFTREISFCMIVSAFITAVGFALLTIRPKPAVNQTQSRG